MINGKDNNASSDTRGLFVRFLNPIWQGITNRMSLHNGILGAVQKELEKTQKDMVDSKLESYLSTATGSFLNHWGDFVGLSRRPGESDEDYRARITKYIIVLRSTIPAIQDALYDYFGDHNANINIYEPFRDIFYTNRSMLNGKDHLQGNYYRYAVIDISIDRPFDYDEVMAVIDKFKPAGVLVHITYNPSLQTGFGIVTGLHDNFNAALILTELQYFTGYLSSKKDLMVLATAELMSKSNIFRTNRSLMNSDDVLAGSPLQGDKPSFHGAFLAPTTLEISHDTTVQDLLGKYEECATDMYTATAHPGGAKAEIVIPPAKQLYYSFDLLEYYMSTSKESYISKPIKYIKVMLEDSNSGMDLGYLTALGEDGADKAVGAKWSVPVQGEKPFRVFDNGDNLINQLDRRSFATLQLKEPAVLKSIQIDNSYNGSIFGGIYVSENGEDYYNVFYGEFSNKKYPLIDVSSLGGVNDTTYGDFLAGIYSNAQAHLYIDTGRTDGSYELRAYDFVTQTFTTIYSMTTDTKSYVPLVGNISNMSDFISDSGLMVISLAPPGLQDIKVDYVGVVLTHNIGFRYTLELPIELLKPELSQQTGLIKLDNTTLYDTILPSMGNGSSGNPKFSYVRPVRRIRAEISTDNDSDPNVDKYFRTSKDGTPETSDLYGFGVGILAEEGVATDSRAIITYKRIYNMPNVTYEVPLKGSNLTIDMHGWDYTIKSIEVVMLGSRFTGKAYNLDYQYEVETDISNSITNPTTLRFNNNIEMCAYLYEDAPPHQYPPIDKHFFTRSITNAATSLIDTELVVSSNAIQQPVT